jgi:hypothetical protein
MYKLWLKAEDEFLLHNFKLLSTQDIAITLNRTIRSIEHRITKLDLNQKRKYNSAIDRFMIKIAISNKEFNGTPCWEWFGYKDERGYGNLKDCQIQQRAYGWAYKYFFGKVPKGLELDHLCNNTSCVNASHLKPVTHKENVLRGNALSAHNARKTKCIHGHEFNQTNTHIDKTGARHCRVCGRNRKRLKND